VHHGVQVVGVPFWGNLANQIIENSFSDAFFNPLDPRTKRLAPCHTFTDAVAGVQASQRSIGKIPFPGIEAKPLVDHDRSVSQLRCFEPVARCSEEKGLPAIRVARPFVEDQHARKIVQVFNLHQLFVRQKIKQRQTMWIPPDSGNQIAAQAGTGCAL
jgi:hypothetical protein